MNGLYTDDWKRDGVLIRAVLKVFNRWNIQMDYTIWSPAAWQLLKKEHMCTNAQMHVTLESQALQAWNCAGGFVNFRRGMDAVASKHGGYWEQGFPWSIHLYALPTPKALNDTL